MIQDKIFFDEKDPTGLSYNTPFTYYGSYQGRLWSKSPSGSIQYYTQNSDLSAYATTGSNQFSGSQTVTGSLTVTGTITGTVAGTTATASYVEYANVANKPALISGSAQISFNGITDKPTLVSGSSQVTYSGLSGIPSGIISGSAQIASFGYATTGSNGFNGSQSITGSLTVTGQVVAQTLNVQQVTSSIVYSSGSNVFGNSLANTQQFTGSLQVTGSTHYILGNLGIGTTSPDVFSRGDERNVGVSVPGASDNLALALNAGGSAGRGAQIYMGQGGTRHFTLSSNASETRVGTATSTPLILTTNETTRLTIAASTGAATFSSSVTANQFISNATNVGDEYYFIKGNAAVNNNFSIYAYSNYVYFNAYNSINIRANNTGGSGGTINLTGGNVGIGTTDTQNFRLAVDGPNVTQGDANTTIRIFDTTSATTGTGGGISFAGYFNGTTSFANTLSYIKGGKENSTAGNYASYLSFGTRVNDGNPTERMRITSDGNVLIGTTSNPGQKMHVYSSGTTRIRVDGAGNNSGVLLAESGANKWSIATVSNDLVFYNEVASSTQMRIASSGAITTPFNLGKAYSQTSGAGTGTSIVDTGITYDTGDFGGYSRGATYQVVFNGNPNQGGSSAYFAQYTGIIMIYTGWNGSAVTTYIEYTQLAAGNNIGGLTLTPRFWNGSSEVSSIGVYTGGYQIRLKISGYNSGYTGADQTVYLKKIS